MRSPALRCAISWQEFSEFPDILLPYQISESCPHCLHRNWVRGTAMLQSLALRTKVRTPFREHRNMLPIPEALAADLGWPRHRIFHP